MPTFWKSDIETRKQSRDRRRRSLAEHIRVVRAYVFDREHGLCRCCGWRWAQSMHELRSAGAMGSRRKAVNPHNSIAVCGSGTTGCHGLLQANRIRWSGDAEGVLRFFPKTPAAAEWLQRRVA